MDAQELQSLKLRFGIIGNSQALNHAVEVAAKVAPTDMSVLISGESGTGKESFSKIIHGLSKRKHGPFIAINCGAIPEGTIDSELFGHEKGAFTGATEKRKGYFEEVNGGSIFLDEVGEMPLESQARLLRILENGEYIKVGSSKVLKTDVRVIAATNVKLMEAVKKGKFREDLYYRLNIVPIKIPPLRERGRDIALLFRKFASDYSDQYRIAPISLDDNARELILKYSFPGNIRQLRNLVEQISVLEMDRMITAEKLQSYLPVNEQSTVPMLFDAANKGDGASNMSDRDLLYRVLFDMKRDVSELKKLVLNLMQGGSSEYSTILNENKHLFTDLEQESFKDSQPQQLLLDQGSSAGGRTTKKTVELDSIQDIAVEEEEESLSLEKKEQELIVKALKKNNNRRKDAARDLGISERTLYRKIKQYGLE